MKRKVFNSSVLGNRTVRSGNYVAFKKAGLIVFSKDLSAIVSGKKVQFVQDEDRPKDWYLEITKDAAGIATKTSDKIQRECMQSSVIVNSIRESLGLEADNFEITVSGDPDTTADGKSYALLTATAAPQIRGGGKLKVKD